MKRKRIALALTVATVLLALVFALQAMALGLLAPTTTWNVTPQSKDFPGDRGCPAGSTLVSDQFQSVTQGDPGVFTQTYMVDGEMVTVQITTYADNSFDFNVVNGQMHALFVKGGKDSGYLLFQYEPPVAGATNTGPVTYDTGLHDGYNAGGTTYQDVSHLDFCLEGGGGLAGPLSVSKTATPSFDREYSWTIEKDVVGDDVKYTATDATFNYLVTLDKTTTDSNWRVCGEISVTNPNPYPVYDVDITDAVAVDSLAPVTIASDVDFAAGETKYFNYCQPLGGAYSGTNTATATWTDEGDNLHEDSSDAVPFSFAGVDPTIVTGYPCVNVSDSAGGALGQLCDDGSFSYSLTWPGVPGACTAYDNTATIVETGQSSTETVTVCTGLDLVVSKDASPSFDRTYTWDILKSVVGPDQKYTSTDATFDYLVTLDKTTTDGNWAVAGTITVANPNDWPIICDVTDLVDGMPCVIDGGGTGVVVPANGSVDLDYSCDLAGAFDGTNTATATWDKDLYFTPNGTASGTANFSFAGVMPTEYGYDCVNVTDSEFGALGLFCDDATIPYSLTWDGVPGACTAYDNTATIVETGQSSTETVTVCMGEDLVVTKDAYPTFDRALQWHIDKSVDQTYVTQMWGEAEFNYSVRVWQDGYTDSNWAVAGTITVANPNDWAITCDVTDAIGAMPCTIDGGGMGVVVPANGSVDLDYSCDLAGAVDGTNTATATWDKDLYYTPTGTASGTADFTFAGVMPDLTDDCVDVTDTFAGYLGEVCGAGADHTFTYQRFIEVLEGCYDYDNTATFTTNDTGATGSDSVTVTVCGPVFMDETAWAANGNIPLQLPYNSGKKKGSWATYVAYNDVSKTTTLFAAKTIPVGSVKFSACSEGMVTIDIVLSGDWEFAYEDGVVQVQDYATAPSGNPSPGQFAYKADAESPQTATIVVPCNNYYGVHADVGQWVLPD